jgi:hypothetical protein
MHEPEQYGEDAGGTVFRDVILLALCGFVAIVVLLLPHLNPPVKANDETTEPPGNVIIEIRWPDKLDTDIDLWVQAPGDVPVGYSNKGGMVFNLLRDDLGRRADPTELNYEIAYSRGIPSGEYTVNVHLYRNNETIYPVSVTVVASMRSDIDLSIQPLVETKVSLVRENEEITAFRFTINDMGKLVAGSVHSLQKDLRSWGSG